MSSGTTTETAPAPASLVPAPPAAPLGLLLLGPAAGERVAGVPAGARAALLLRRAGCARVLAVGARETLGRRAEWVEPAGELPREGTVVVVAGDPVFDRAILEKTIDAAREGAGACVRGASGFVLVAPASVAGAVVAAHARGGVAEALHAVPSEARDPGPAGLFLPATTPAERRAATRAILRATGKSVDGPLTQLFERRISQAISGTLLPLPVTPNMMTTVSLLIGLTGAALLATTGNPARSIGAATFVFATIVDGCDGEIARAKLLESSFGKVYDTAVDIVVNAAVFVGIGVGVWREFLGVPEVLAATLLLVVGGVLAMTAVESVRRLAPTPPAGSGLARVQEWAERFATMEWCYLVLALALVGQVPFFFWGAAIGANVFAILYFVLGVLAWRRG